MLNYGDIRKLTASDVPPADVVIGGSPCQNLSIAGNRKGLQGKESKLFLEQIRLIKEMRKKYAKTRFMVWENVPGALTSNKKNDFRRVLEETIRVSDSTAPDIPIPKRGWSTAGCIMGRGCSVAWRVFDAQFWGTPQRRRRIALVADFDGKCAPEILFERKGSTGSSESGTCEEKSTSAQTGRGTDPTNAGIIIECSSGTDIAETLDASYYKGTGMRGSIERTIVAVPDVELYSGISYSEYKASNTASPCVHVPMIGGYNNNIVVDNKTKYRARRLTPLECERLQGYPDNYTDIGEWIDSKGKIHKTSSDTVRFKALGNSIALPSWRYVLSRLITYTPNKTMLSLFDGIGGFPLIWNELCGTTVGVSEIEDFPIAVTNKHFGTEDFL